MKSLTFSVVQRRKSSKNPQPDRAFKYNRFRHRILQMSPPGECILVANFRDGAFDTGVVGTRECSAPG
jgi:hypothetical protein